MKKILFWIDDILHFGIAKFFSNKPDFDLFAIYDITHKQKQFFSNQTLINFKQNLFFRDHIANLPSKPDLQYLSNFERQTNINLWSLIYSERSFYRFNEFFNFKRSELLGITEQICKFTEKVLDEIDPDFLIIHMTDVFRNLLFCEICRSRNVKILMLNPTRFGFKTMISSEFDKFDSIIVDNSKKSKFRNLLELKEYEKNFSSYKQGEKIYRTKYLTPFWKRPFRYLRILSETDNPEFKSFYENFGKTKAKLIYKRFPLKTQFNKIHVERFLDQNAITKISKDTKFIFFPLHIEPERSLTVNAPFFTNQIEFITSVAKSVPLEYKLYVKEHPVMGIRNWRKIEFYKEILELPNVVLIHPSVKSEELLKHCSLVITIAGTAGIEGAFYKKPCIVFSDVSYKNLPFVKRLYNFDYLFETIQECLSKKYDFSSINEYVNLIEKSSIDFDLTGLYNETRREFYYGGILTDLIDIPQQRVEKFLEEHKAEFEQLVLEHLRIISNYDENKPK